ncbi:flagellar biosynthesis regulator FlaF [Roseomonas sp. GC11]|uniref:flagellar biosynthesis regulator FlaF n=1 Tax=Roseomonas sp. GC11 TaxID=2950546 RepID=UPI002108E557|nr:flagellar biosynthesis regulator FlaF [Roseomonas sp. GC11]MCQ4159940.1 flagellar biosynthesis regulator FlaF [Roseomonas sp. GC11]
MLNAAQDDSFQIPLQRPRGAAQAYGSVIRGTEDQRDIEYRVLARVTARLEAAMAADAGPAAIPHAIHENRMVWITFASDLASSENTLDEAIKARLLSLAHWVMGESDRVLRQGGTVQALCDVNRAIMSGLKPASPPEGIISEGTEPG